MNGRKVRGREAVGLRKQTSGNSEERKKPHTVILRGWLRFVCRSKLKGKNMKYTVILERESDGGFVASVPVLPGCVSQGDTKEEAIANIKEAVNLYLEDCLAAGDPVPVEDSREFIELEPALGG